MKVKPLLPYYVSHKRMPAYMKNIVHTLVYADNRWGYVRHKFCTFEARSHTMAHADIRRSRILFLNMLKNFGRIQAYGLYVKHTVGIR